MGNLSSFVSLVGTLFEKLPKKPESMLSNRNRKLLRKNSCKPGVVSLQCTLNKKKKIWFMKNIVTEQIWRKFGKRKSFLLLNEAKKENEQLLANNFYLFSFFLGKPKTINFWTTFQQKLLPKTLFWNVGISNNLQNVKFYH